MPSPKDFARGLNLYDPPQNFPNPSDPSMYRYGDASWKGKGFLGPLQNTSGQTMSEYSIGVPINGKQTEIPSMVPTLSPKEIAHLLGGGELTDEMVRKATNYAYARQSRGLPFFADAQDAVMPYPQPELK